MPRQASLVIVSILSLLLAAAALWLSRDRSGKDLSALHLAAPPTGGDFVLQGAAGPVDLASLRGKVVLLYFGYTTCPDICPTNLAFIASALHQLDAAELDAVRVIFVSVDPERDDVQRLARYVAYFHPNILGVTGTPDAVARVARLYGAAYRRVEQTGSAMGYLVDHSAQTYAIDRQGRLARTLDHATPPDQIARTLRELLSGR